MITENLHHAFELIGHLKAYPPNAEPEPLSTKMLAELCNRHYTNLEIPIGTKGIFAIGSDVAAELCTALTEATYDPKHPLASVLDLRMPLPIAARREGLLGFCYGSPLVVSFVVPADCLGHYYYNESSILVSCFRRVKPYMKE